MKKYLFPAIIVLASLKTFAQRSVDSLIQTEKNFANAAVTTSIKEAFLKFIDTAGLIFDRGKPVNGFEFYTRSEKTSGILSWEPELAEISSTNDFGYTTGPWEYYSSSLKDAPVAQGHFITVWHLTREGKWKFLIDFGISYHQERKGMPLAKVHEKKDNPIDKGESSLIESEQKFVNAYTAEGARAYHRFLSSNSRLNYSGFLPATNAIERKKLLDSLPLNLNYTTIGFGLSPMKDMGFVYGWTTINNKQEGYLRIWRREKNEWKIAMEVLRFK